MQTILSSVQNVETALHSTIVAAIQKTARGHLLWTEMSCRKLMTRIYWGREGMVGYCVINRGLCSISMHKFGTLFCANQIYKDFEFDRFLLTQHAGFMRAGTIYPVYEFHRLFNEFCRSFIERPPFLPVLLCQIWLVLKCEKFSESDWAINDNQSDYEDLWQRSARRAPAGWNGWQA